MRVSQQIIFPELFTLRQIMFYIIWISRKLGKPSKIYTVIDTSLLWITDSLCSVFSDEADGVVD